MYCRYRWWFHFFLKTNTAIRSAHAGTGTGTGTCSPDIPLFGWRRIRFLNLFVSQFFFIYISLHM
jgi:hypothetical protein